jgi:transcriptional regulator with XRE-family HTH domain
MENPEVQHIREAFGTVLRQKRKAHGYSQEELAHNAGITMRYISLLERNQRQPTISTLYLLCKALEVSMGEFVLEMEKETN